MLAVLQRGVLYGGVLLMATRRQRKTAWPPSRLDAESLLWWLIGVLCWWVIW